MATEREAESFLSGVILAAGASSRMGRPKQLLELERRALLQHVLDQVSASRLDELVLVLGHQACEIQQELGLASCGSLRVVVNPDPEQGLSASLRLGLRSTDPRATGAAILLGDQPGVTHELIDRVATAFLSAGTPMARPVFLDGDGHRRPSHPVFLARRCWPELEGLEGDQGARGLLARRPDWLTEVFVEGDPPADIDTWEDYRRAVDATLARVIRH